MKCLPVIPERQTTTPPLTNVTLSEIDRKRIMKPWDIMIRIKEENDKNVSRQKREEQKNSTTKLSLRNSKFENEKEQSPAVKRKHSVFNIEHSN